jgi:hypothetical protein
MPCSRDLAEPLANGIALAQDVGVVVEEHHANDPNAMAALFELRQDHLAELVASCVPTRAENVRDLHEYHASLISLTCDCRLQAPNPGGYSRL